MALTVGLFRTLGPRRTRFVAQIVAAIVGAFFVIGVQAVAILSTNTLSRFAALQSDLLKAIAPGRRQRLLVAGARHHGRHAPRCLASSSTSAACSGRVDRGLLRAASPRHATAAAGISATSIRQRRARRCVPPDDARKHAAPQGMDAAPARSLARLADADAGALPAAAGAAALAEFRRRGRYAGRARPGLRHGGGAACRRARLAGRVGRGCARPRRHRADLRPQRTASKARGRDRRDRAGALACRRWCSR